MARNRKQRGAGSRPEVISGHFQFDVFDMDFDGNDLLMLPAWQPLSIACQCWFFAGTNATGTTFVGKTSVAIGSNGSGLSTPITDDGSGEGLWYVEFHDNRGELLARSNPLRFFLS